ncbi:transketolase [Humidesulfovibrio mexicanus]|uniref:Transketolase n=1 Tax=Humidesulfovibrio mexicanus TaxID=147047 RepID=A0A238Y801_9BACT|nr:transketolase C-terminal domain-containing protein [Humidesulfovibrio mexicanus]SNR66773.1 transketolase [Humidesulfovibrio mexicanus]
MPTPCIITREDIARVRASVSDRHTRAELTADLCRLNTLAAVKIAGSGHLGSSLSAMDIVVWLYTEVMNTLEVGVGSPHRDVYFSSKGHDAPGLYALLYAMGVIKEEKLLLLRRLGGLDGHPDVKIPGVEANTGSLGMGIGKGRGMAVGKTLQGHGGTVYVLLGDGELQEGQIYESLQTTAQQKTGNLVVIVDHNKVQSDKFVSQITDLGDLEAKFRVFGWHVERCDGNSMAALDAALTRLREVAGPRILIADTIKGRGVSFMEHPSAMPEAQSLYPWHSGAPADEPFARAWGELLARVNARLEGLGIAPVAPKEVSPRPKAPSGVTREYVADAYGKALVELARANEKIVVLDGDLAADCRVRLFEQTFPERFVENGIAEMDMVSMAGGLARAGMVPVVNTFASFLASRPNEQIYNNASERTKIIYVCHYAGLIPAGPGKSHQSLRDISLLGATPGITMLQPCNSEETEQALSWCVNKNPKSSMLRLIIGPSPRRIELPPDYALRPGWGTVLRQGTDAVLISYGPVMLHEALGAAEILAEKGFSLMVVNMPWLNCAETYWLASLISRFSTLHVLEDHSPVGGLGDCLSRVLHKKGLGAGVTVRTFGVEGWPACGTPPEALEAHGLDAKSLAEAFLKAGPTAVPGWSLARARGEIGHKPPKPAPFVGVISMHKCGSQTAYWTAKGSFPGCLVRHAHGLSTFHVQVTPSKLQEIVATRMACANSSAKPVIITLTREPLAVLRSALFHKYGEKVRDYFAGSLSAQSFDNFFEQFACSFVLRFRNYFDREIRDVFGVDVLSLPSPEPAGYVIGEGELARVAVIRLEDFNRVYAEVYRALGGEPPIQPVCRNVAEGNPDYERFKAEYAIAPEIVAAVRSFPWYRHMYPETAGRAAG